MRIYWLILIIILLDLAAFWILKEAGVLIVRDQPSNWVKDAFFLPMAVAGGIGLLRSLYEIWLGWTFDVFGGGKVSFSEEPFDYIYSVVLKLVICGFLSVAFTMLIFGYGT